MSSAGKGSEERLRAILRNAVPFRFLPGAVHDGLVSSGSFRSFGPGQRIVSQGAEDEGEVFLLLSGSAESVDEGRNPPFRVTVIKEGMYFGERRAVFSTPRQYAIVALGEVECFALPRAAFLEALASSRAFAQSLGQILREGQGIFRAFERFTGEVLGGAARGHIELRTLLPLYKALEPALHPLANADREIDWPALSYAARRLPENVASTFLFLLSDDIPFMYGEPEAIFRPVRSEARHRFVYEMLPGKDLVLIRSGSSDLMDFVTCLCIFAVEARKIRYRYNHPDLLASLAADCQARAEAAREGAEPPPRAEAPDAPPFTPQEREQLESLWPGKTQERLRETAFHRQAYALDVRTQAESHNARLPERWTEEVGAAAERLLGIRPAELPGDFEVHLISSNTHSVSNCLNPFFPRHADAIFAWAEAAGLRGEPWTDPYDELYALARGFVSAHPDAKPGMREGETERGIIRLPETVTTGIQVQLVDAALLRPGFIDPSIGIPEAPRRKLIVNIDYAFGEQALHIMRSLLLLFGRNVRSISVIGKAGALLGNRGDILAPTAFIEQRSDTFDALPAPDGAELRAVLARLPGRAVHSGPMLTVEGTLLQNQMMLNFYRSIWGCVGLEMEGIYYHWAATEAIQLGVARRDLRERFLYYVSDLPGNASARLSAPLAQREGIPPLYAITREVLSRIID